MWTVADCFGLLIVSYHNNINIVYLSQNFSNLVVHLKGKVCQFEKTQEDTVWTAVILILKTSLLENHTLPIECVRWSHTPKENQNYPLCEDVGIGDEHNYLLQCKFLTPDRKKNPFWEVNFTQKNCNLLTLREIMSTSKQSKIRNFCNFVRVLNNEGDSLSLPPLPYFKVFHLIYIWFIFNM